jgi:hypothetical protein
MAIYCKHCDHAIALVALARHAAMSHKAFPGRQPQDLLFDEVIAHYRQEPAEVGPREDLQQA